MKSKLTLIILTFFVQTIKAQYYVTENKNIDEIKSGTTYVIMKDPNSNNLAPIKNAIRQGWTFTKGVEFITPEQINDHLKPENTFMTVVIDVFYSSTTSAFPSIDLKIWQLNKKYLLRKGAIEKQDMVNVATITVSTDPNIARNSNQKDVENWNWNLSEKATNWIPGIIKNNLQGIAIRLQEINQPVKKEAKNTELSALKNDTLYVAAFSLLDYKGEIRNNSEKIFTEYNYKYKIIDSEELNNKIMRGEKFYYATFIRSSSANVFFVTNSLTGKQLFSHTKLANFNLSSKSLEELYNTIKKQ